jgi:hypothetical protein
MQQQQQQQRQQQMNNNNYQSSPMPIQQQQQPPSHTNTTVNTPQLSSSYAMTPPNSGIMNSSSFSPVTNTFFSPSFNSISGYFNGGGGGLNQSPQLQPQRSLQGQMQGQTQGQMQGQTQGQMQMNISQLQMPPPMPQQQQQSMYSSMSSMQPTTSSMLPTSSSMQMPLQMPLQYQNNMAAGVNAVLGQAIKTHKIYRPYFQLEMYVPKNIRSLYEKLVADHNQVVLPIIVGTPGEYNAGFDLLVPSKMTIGGYNTVKIDHLVKCRMTKIIPHSSHPINMFQDSNGILRQYNTTILPVGFYLYPRSSTGTKTPLRLANSVGIIDSGYRGPLIAAFDNWKGDDFDIEDKQRLVQICAPDLSYPIYVVLVDSEEELGKTSRGSGGFGSTG